MQLEPLAEANSGGEIYAKVIDASARASGQARIRFTSVALELKVWVR